MEGGKAGAFGVLGALHGTMVLRPPALHSAAVSTRQGQGSGWYALLIHVSGNYLVQAAEARS